MLANFQWNFYSPIAEPVKAVYGMSDGMISWLSNANNLTQVLSTMVFAWVMDTHGIRAGALAMVSLLAVATGLACLPTPDESHWGPALASSAVAGVAAAPWNLAPPLISATWFAEGSRTAATAVMLDIAMLGQLLCFLLPPHLAPADAPVAAQRRAIVGMLWGMFALALALLVAVGLHLPARPRAPPTASAAAEKLSFASGFAQLLRNKRYWHLLLCCTVPSGMLGAWMAILAINLKPLGIGEAEAAWLGSAQQLAGAAAGVAVGLAADRFSGRIKAFIVAMYAASTAAFLVFALAAETGLLPFSLSLAYATTVLGSAAQNAALPLFLELACETVYPIGEGAVAGLLILAQNLVGTLFLAVPIDLLGTRWQIWAVVGSVAAGMLLMLGFLEDYRRLGVDRAAAGAKAAGAKAAGAMAADARAGSVTATGQIQGA